MAPPLTSEVLAKLAGQQGKFVANFNQSEDGRGWQVGSEMAEGYCQGVCLDWVRRVLQGGRPSFSENPEKKADIGYDFQKRKHSQAERQGNAWSIYYAKKEQTRLRVNKKVDLYNDIIHYTNQFVNSAADTVITSDVLVKMLKDAGWKWTGGGASGIPLKNLREIKNAELLEKDEAKLNADKVSWKNFGENMDLEFKKRRSFSNIELLHSEPKKSYGSLAILADAVTKPFPHGYKPGCAVIWGIKFDTNKGPSGHAVSAIFEDEGTHLFLDPNYGMFRYADINGVRGALVYLFKDVYPKFDSITSVRNEVNWETFGVKSGAT